MITTYTSPKGTPYVLASHLHILMGISTPLRKWFPRMIDIGFEEGKDFSEIQSRVELAQGGHNLIKDWAVRIEMAKHIAIVQKSPEGKAIREFLIRQDTKVKEGQLLSRPQISALFELCKVMGFFSVQKRMERKHFDVFEGEVKNWWPTGPKHLGKGRRN